MSVISKKVGKILESLNPFYQLNGRRTIIEYLNLKNKREGRNKGMSVISITEKYKNGMDNIIIKSGCKIVRLTK